MEYFMSHIVYILVAGLVIGAICCVWAFASIKWQEQKAAEGGSESEGMACGMGCAGCAMAAGCNSKQDHHSAPVH